MSGYSERYLENVIRIMEIMNPKLYERVYEWADANEKSGIDEFKYWIKDLATRFEEIWETFREDDEVDYIGAIQTFVSCIGEIEDEEVSLPLPLKDNTRKKILEMCTPVRKKMEKGHASYVWILEKTSNDDFITGGTYYYASLDALANELEKCGVTLTNFQREATEKMGGAVWNTPKMLYRARKQGVIS